MEMREAHATITIMRVTADQVELVVPLFLTYEEFYGRTLLSETASEYLRKGMALGESVIFLAR